MPQVLLLPVLERPQLGARLVFCLLGPQDPSQLKADVCGNRVQLLGTLEVDTGLFPLLLPRQHESQVVTRVGMVRSEFCRARKVALRIRVATDPAQSDSSQVMQLELVH